MKRDKMEGGGLDWERALKQDEVGKEKKKEKDRMTGQEEEKWDGRKKQLK